MILVKEVDACSSGFGFSTAELINIQYFYHLYKHELI